MAARSFLRIVSTLIAILLAASVIHPASAVSISSSAAGRPSTTARIAAAAAADHTDLVDIVTGRFVRLAIAGTRLYAGEDLINHGALSIFDISGGAPQRLSRTELPGGVASIALAGTRAYVAVNPIQGLPRLYTLDVSDPRSPKQLGDAQITVTGGISQVQVAGNVAYMTYASGGFDIYNIANPTNLVPVGGYFSEATALVVRGNRAYLTGGNSGFIILDISNPASPQ
jgi:hypothetical protein